METGQSNANIVEGMIDQRFMLRVFGVFVALAVLSAGVSVAGKWFGQTIVMAGHTDDTTVHRILVSKDVFAIPANAIREPAARADHPTDRIDLYLSWPSLEGYSAAHQGAFNHVKGAGIIVFVSVEPQSMSRDMSGRFDPIYLGLIEPGPRKGPDGLSLYPFSQRSGFANEILAVGKMEDGDRFVARCLTGPVGENSLAPCQRDVDIGRDLSMTYRFPAELLGEWRTLDAALTKWIGERRAAIR